VKYAVLVPDAVVVATAVVVLLAGRLGFMPRAAARTVPAVVVVITLIAFGVELWAGATLGTYFGGALVQDRFALFAKAAALLAAAAAIATADWTAEDVLSIGLAMPLLAAFGVMVAASSADIVGLWAGLELAGAAGIVAVSLRRPDLALRLLVAGGIATALFLLGLAFVYATTGNSDLSMIRAVLLHAAPTLPLAIPVALLLAGLALRAGLAPFHIAAVPAELGASPLGAGLVLGLVALAAGIVAMKLAAVLLPVPAVFSTYLSVLAAVAMVGGGAAALAVRSPRPRMAYLATSQIGWVAAGLASHHRAGIAAALFLLGAFAVAAASGPALLGRAEGGEAAIHGLGGLRPARAAGLALAMLSLAGAPPLAGFFGQMAVAAGLAQSGQWGLLSLGVVGSILSVAAVVGTLRVLYIQSPLEESRRGPSALPAVGGFSTLAAVAFCFVIAGYGVLSNPILGLADQGAEALGLR
jgi:NADH-quinone oxidoreductase subunit N